MQVELMISLFFTMGTLSGIFLAYMAVTQLTK